MFQQRNAMGMKMDGRNNEDVLSAGSLTDVMRVVRTGKNMDRPKVRKTDDESQKVLWKSVISGIRFGERRAVDELADCVLPFSLRLR